ncbi:MAG: biopolymer transporter ExbD [Planctomycetota bacterium]
MSVGAEDAIDHGGLSLEAGPGGLPKKEREEEEPDITPMIDITFLLLIFFLVASTPDQQTAIELPDAQHGVPVSQLTSVVFTVGDGGRELAPVFEADGKLPEFALSENEQDRNREIEEAIRRGFDDNKTDVVIKADKSVAFRQVDKVIRASSKVEGIKLHLAVLETE